MRVPNEYWTKIPDGTEPIGQLARDGVLVEDDMALRALLPHIRPKRGRKRADCGDETPLSAQRLRRSPSSATEDQSHIPLAPWPSLGEPHLSAHLDVPRSAYPGSGPGAGDGPQTPFGRYPNSAITPTNKTAFWDDAREPQSAITPSQPKMGRHRRGPKNVSSAWNLGGSDSGAKKRGRPRINHTPVDGASFSFQHWNPAQSQTPQSDNSSNLAEIFIPQSSDVAEPPDEPGQAVPAPVLGPGQQNRGASEAQRPARPSISLQVPQRTGGPVRLATPPPALMINGQQEPQQGGDQLEGNSANAWYGFMMETAVPFGASHQLVRDGCPGGSKVPDYYFERIEDRTNVDAVLAFLMRAAQDGEWFDCDGNPDKPPSMDETAAIVNSLLQDMLKTATSTQDFLNKLGALAGTQALMGSRPKYYRLSDGDGFHNYRFVWGYRFGHLRADSHMAQSVPWSMWKRPVATEDGVECEGNGGEALSAEEWKKKYQALLGEMEKRERELSDLRGKVMSTLREDRG